MLDAAARSRKRSRAPSARDPNSPACSIKSARATWWSSRIDRLARSTRDLLDIAEKLNEASAGLRSLAEPWANTTSSAGRMVLTVFAGIAEFERALIHQRTSSGRIAAKARGVRFGRPTKLSPEQIALGQRLVGEGTSVREAAKLLKCHHATLYRSLNAPIAGH